ncbi:unnamed protein product, partial [Mesorhabditis belari]|uniref:Uncharacterized protein n=1 Tax=Mesorhabditis belari TaxID=2138241 RepID=A0AAF3EZR9_9BILA
MHSLIVLSMVVCWLGSGEAQSTLSGALGVDANAVTTSPNCAGTTEWLAWSEWSSCSDTCGSCGIHTRTRTCLTSSVLCTCPGESTMIEYCNLFVCKYPRDSCCFNFTPRPFSGSFACLDANSTVTATTVTST